MEEIIQTNNRREFLKKTGALLGLSLSLPVLGNILTSCSYQSTSPEEPLNLKVNLGTYPDLNNIGGFAMIKTGSQNGGYPVLIIRESSSSFLVVSTKCSHMGCTVGSPDSNKQIHCPCHGSIYSAIDGSVIHGPAPAALTKLPYSFDSGTNTITVT